MSKRVKLVRPIAGVMQAFVHGEKPPANESIRTQCRTLSFNGRLLHYTGMSYGVPITKVVGVTIKPRHEALYCNRYFAWQSRMSAVLATDKCRIPHLHRYGFDWSVPTEEDDYRIMLANLFALMERDAIHGGNMTRDQVVAEWARICHGIGLGHIAVAPPNTGY